MNLARLIFSNQYCATGLIYLFGKRYKINENDKSFHWLCLNKASNYLIFWAICQLADHCCVMKNDKGFHIGVDMKENAVLINDIRKWLLSRKMVDRIGNDYGANENICTFRIYKLWIFI